MALAWRPHQDAQVLGHELFKDRFWGRFVTDVGKAAAAAARDEFEREAGTEGVLEVRASAKHHFSG